MSAETTKCTDEQTTRMHACASRTSTQPTPRTQRCVAMVEVRAALAPLLSSVCQHLQRCKPSHHRSQDTVHSVRHHKATPLFHYPSFTPLSFLPPSLRQEAVPLFSSPLPPRLLSSSSSFRAIITEISVVLLLICPSPSFLLSVSLFP